MNEELRRARAAVRRRIEGLSGRRARGSAGAGARPGIVNYGALDLMALETGGEVRRDGSAPDAMAYETLGEMW